MDDDDIRAEARRIVRRKYGRRLDKRYAIKVQRTIETLRKQRDNLRRACSQGDDRERGVLVYGPHIKGVHGSSVDSKPEGNIIRGLCKRIASKQSYDPGEIRKFKSFVKQFVKRHFQPLPYIPATHEFLDMAWLDGSKYNQEEKRLFHERLDAVLNAEVSLLKIKECKIFVKREVTEEVKEPRIISSRSDYYKAIVAPYIKKIEEAVYNEHFIKHCNPQQVTERIKRVLNGYTYYYETDYSSFESSYSPEFFNACEYQLFKHMFRNNPHIWRYMLLALDAKNVLVCPHLYAKLTGSRMSGEMWTSLGNGFSNMMMIEYMAHNLSQTKAFRYDYLVEGDDGLIGTTSHFDLSIVKKLGFKLTLREGSSINDLSFCGMIMGPHDRLYCNPERTMIKFGRTMDMRIINQYGQRRFERVLDEEMYTKALSMSVYGSNNPVINEVIRTVLRNCKHKEIRMKSLDYWESDILRVQDYWDATRVRELDGDDYKFVSEAFGIREEELKDIGRAVCSQVVRNFSIRARLRSDQVEATPYHLFKRV